MRRIILDVDAQSKKEKPKKEKKQYVDVIEQQEMQLTDSTRIVFSVSQDSPEHMPHADLRTWVESERYSGPTRAGFNFPVNQLKEFRDIVDKMIADTEDVEGDLDKIEDNYGEEDSDEEE